MTLLLRIREQCSLQTRKHSRSVPTRLVLIAGTLLVLLGLRSRVGAEMPHCAVILTLTPPGRAQTSTQVRIQSP
jgi:hypothetical protein